MDFINVNLDIGCRQSTMIMYWIIGNYKMEIIQYKLKKNDGLDGDNHVKNSLLSHLGEFFLSKSKGIMSIFIREINAFYKICKYYGDTDSLYIRKNLGCIRQS